MHIRTPQTIYKTPYTWGHSAMNSTVHLHKPSGHIHTQKSDSDGQQRAPACGACGAFGCGRILQAHVDEASKCGFGETHRRKRVRCVCEGDFGAVAWGLHLFACVYVNMFVCGCVLCEYECVWASMYMCVCVCVKDVWLLWRYMWTCTCVPIDACCHDANACAACITVWMHACMNATV